MKKLFVIAAMAALSMPVLAGNNNGPQFGGGGDATANAGALGVGVGIAGAAAGASANNRNSVGVNNANFNANHNYLSSSQALSNKNTSINTNSNRAYGGNAYSEGSRAEQGQLQGQLQTQGNKQVLQYNESEGIHYSGKYDLANVPDAYAPSVQPTIPCSIPLNGAGSGVGFGISLGTAFVDKNCELREDIRLGLTGDATSKALANELIQERLRGHMSKAEGEQTAGVKPVNSLSGTTSEGIFALTDY